LCPDPDVYFLQIKELASQFLSPLELGLLDSAYRIAGQAHGFQSRDSGELYIFHPLSVVEYLVGMRMDIETILAAMLHDVVEDTNVPLETIENTFGKEVSYLVDGVTKLGHLKPPPGVTDDVGSILGQADTYDKMMLATADDLRVILVKLADRLHNMRTIMALPMQRRKKVVNSTLRIYIPMAARLGIWSVKTEMEDLALQALEPDTYQELSFVLKARSETHQFAVTNIHKLLQHRLSDWGISSDCYEMPASISETFWFLKQSGLAFSQIQETLICRVLVPRTMDCYSALGVIHSLWKPIPGRIDDYIVSPKENLYRSLHTSVIGPGGTVLKFRIRTQEMDEWANFGIFAFWRRRDNTAAYGKPEERIAWLSRMSEWRKELGDMEASGSSVESEIAQEFVESLMSDFLPEHIDVFTPKGDVYELPKGATPLDFAYKIHTKLGHSCRAARINDQIRPLNFPLRNGDQVFILSIPHEEPLYEWLDPDSEFISTSLAKRSVLRWFRRQSKDVQIKRGSKILATEFALLGYDQFDLLYISSMFGFNDPTIFLMKIGSAEILISTVSKRFLEVSVGLKSGAKSDSGSGVVVTGAGSLKMRMAKCCHPYPGTSILGILNQDDQVSVHRMECRYALKALEKGNIIALAWHETSRTTRPVRINVEAFDRRELLNDFTLIVSQENVNMSQVFATTEKEKNHAEIQSILEIENSSQLLKILHKIAQLPNVLKVQSHIFPNI
jgi:GTP pyrophosphokinase